MYICIYLHIYKLDCQGEDFEIVYVYEFLTYK